MAHCPQRCDAFPSESWSAVPGLDETWTFDPTTNHWRTVLTGETLSAIPAGAYTYHALDTASGLRGKATVELQP